MSSIAVQKVAEGQGIPPSWLTTLLEFSEQVRHKAFELFEESGKTNGHDVNHWLEAEKQLLTVPRYELLETPDHIDVCIAVPGFDAAEISVVALADALLVRAASGPEHEKREGELRYSEFNEDVLFRRIALPEEIDVNRVTASLEKGVLVVAAPKVSPASCGKCSSCQCGKEID